MRRCKWRLRFTGAIALLAIACSPAADGLERAVEPPRIEVSDDGAAGPKLGAGDREAERCFREAAAARGCGDDAECRKACAGGDVQACDQLARNNQQRRRPCPGSASCSAACQRGDVGACHELALRFAGELTDSDCAKKLYQLACDAGHAPSCAGLAGRLVVGLGPSGYPKRWSELMAGACQGGFASACTRLGSYYFEGHGGERHDVKEGLELFERGCEKGDPEGCRLAADAYDNVGSSPFADRDKALALRTGACDLGDHTSCVELARQLLFGQGILRDPTRAEQLLQQVCRLDVSDDGGEACHLLAQLMATRLGAADAKVEALVARACAKGQLNACVAVAEQHYHQQRYEDAVAVATRLLDKDGDNWKARLHRGMSLFDLGRHQEAIADLEKLHQLKSDWMHTALWLHDARARAGKPAKPELERASQSMKLSEWPGPVVKFYLGRIDERSLLRQAKNRDRKLENEQLCEAYYYIGQHHLVAGDTKRAASMFRKAVATGVTNFIEYRSAQAELARLASP